jgi:hypothetical protein
VNRDGCLRKEVKEKRLAVGLAGQFSLYANKTCNCKCMIFKILLRIWNTITLFVTNVGDLK